MDTAVTMMEPDAQELIEARMAAMNATIEDLEDTLVLLRQSLNPLPSPPLPTTAHSVPLPIITTAIRGEGEPSHSGSGSGSGSKGKSERRESKSALGRVKGRGKAKSVNDIGLSPRRHASSPDLSQPLPSPTTSIPDSSTKSGSKSKSKSSSSKKSSSKHSKRDSASSSHYLNSYTAPNSNAQSDVEDAHGGKSGKGKRREMLGEKLGVPLTSEQRKGLGRSQSSHGGAKAMLETIFHRRPSHHHRDRATTLSSSSIPTVKSSSVPPTPALPPQPDNNPTSPAVNPAELAHAAPAPLLSPQALVDDLAKYIANIRHQHSSLLTLLPLSNISHPSSGTETLNSPEEYFSDSLDYVGGVAPDQIPKGSDFTVGGGSTQYHTAKSHLPSRLHHTYRPSLSSMYAEVASIYYDAEIEPWNDDDPEAPTGSRYSVGSRSTSLHRASMADVDAHVAEALRSYEEQDQARRQTITPTDRQLSDESVNKQRMSIDTVVPDRGSGSSGSGSGTKASDTEEAQVMQPVKIKPVGPIVRRKGLPAASPASEPSLIGMLRKNVGKDMSTISFDVTFNEPISLLQKLAEEVEYYNLLTLAAQAHDPVERIAHVAAFAVSQYANSKHRTSRKPFNPLQGETYELVREDLGMKFVAEKVTHHPPRMACHSEGPGWVYWCTSAAKNKLSGMSLEIQPLGAQYVMLNGKEQYHWTKPPSYMRNLVAGTKYLETIGDLVVMNDTTGERAVISFEAGGWAGKRNIVNGICYSSGGSKAAWIDGVWDSKLNVRYGSSHDPSHPLWLVNPWPPHPEKNYGFTTWAIELNELTPDLPPILPPSDSRLRPDQRALEEGNFELADRLKNVLEENQRQRRQANGGDVSPRWFKLKKEAGQGGVEEWEYAGGYFEGREEGKLGEKGLGGLFDA